MSSKTHSALAVVSMSLALSCALDPRQVTTSSSDPPPSAEPSEPSAASGVIAPPAQQAEPFGSADPDPPSGPSAPSTPAPPPEPAEPSAPSAPSEPLPPSEPTEPLPPPVVAGPRDCRSTADNDLDGVPDDTQDDVCPCVPDAVEDCDEHPGLDGFGSCRAGTRTCVPSGGYRSTNWSACTGSVGPRDRDCTSALDNDCDGLPDNSLDEVCECQPGAVRYCGDLPVTGSGSEQFEGCGTGTSVCNADPGSRSSSWSECTCAASEYCLTPDGTCGSPQLGVCTVIPTGGCTRELNRMCGCDGQTYGNPCAARSAGVSVDFAGQCAAVELPLETLP